MDRSKIYFVLRGLIDGEEGYFARDTSGHVVDDGWYHVDIGDDPDGVGPFGSAQKAWAAYDLATRLQTWIFPIDGGHPYRDESEEDVSDANVALIEGVRQHPDERIAHYRCSIEGSYETLTLEISCPSHEAAADVFRQVLLASAKYQ